MSSQLLIPPFKHPYIPLLGIWSNLFLASSKSSLLRTTNTFLSATNGATKVSNFSNKGTLTDPLICLF